MPKTGNYATLYASWSASQAVQVLNLSFFVGERPEIRDPDLGFFFGTILRVPSSLAHGVMPHQVGIFKSECGSENAEYLLA